MKNNHDIETYRKLALGAMFYLEESFKYLNSALISDLAELIFHERTKNITPSNEDKIVFDQIHFPDNHIELLQTENPINLPVNTLNRISEQWDKARQIAEQEKYKFRKNHKISSIEILGHLNNLGFFLETLVNRHLLFLNQTNKLDNFSYKQIAPSRILDRVIYIFKDELISEQLQLSEIQNLFKLRNKTVHYTPDNARALQPRISELIQIWTQCLLLIKMFEKKENFVDHKFSNILNGFTDNIKNKWF